MGQPLQFDEIPLQNQLVVEPFEKWALDFVGPIKHQSRQKSYILVCTDYVIKWVEVKELPWETEQAVLDFLYVDIFTRFGVPRDIVTNGGSQFTYKIIKSLTTQYHIKHIVTSPYHPQANEKLEGTNRILESMLTKTIQIHQWNWHNRLPEALWAYIISWISTTGLTPY